MRKWNAVIPVAVAYGVSALAFSALPERGVSDLSMLLPVDLPPSGAVSRVAAALVLPTVALGVFLLLESLAKVPGPVTRLPTWWLNEQTGSSAIERFEPTYGAITFAVTSLILLAHMAFLGSLLGWPAWSYRVVTAVFGAGLIAAGNVMPRVRPNWIVGLRTKKTLSDPQTWARTHRTLGALLVVSGVIVIALSVIAPRYAIAVGALEIFLSFIASHLAGAEKQTVH
jgi:hypothetical protein